MPGKRPDEKALPRLRSTTSRSSFWLSSPDCRIFLRWDGARPPQLLPAIVRRLRYAHLTARLGIERKRRHGSEARAIFTTATLQASSPEFGLIPAPTSPASTSGSQPRERRPPSRGAPAVQAAFGLHHDSSSAALRAAPFYGPRAIYRFYSQLRPHFCRVAPCCALSLRTFARCRP
jgi:hypothetical protein